ncbi:hypothetical protein FQN52_002227 [Onygenales sp. PD_12]|nr:hypothetical protein FQN52_002227 [Onygenales sp. PD_12]
MTIFIVSLFLPYTIDFHLPKGAHHRRVSSARRAGERRHSADLHKKPLSYFRHHRKTSSASARPTALKELAQLSAAASKKPSKPEGEQPGFPFPTNPDLQLAPSDPVSPTWGSRGVFNQPKAQPPPSPAPSVLQHGISTDIPKPGPDKSQGPIEPILEKQNFADAIWTVEPSEQGNGGLKNAVRSAVDAGFLEDKLWVGTLGMPTDVLEDHTRDEIAEKLETDRDSLPVFVDDGDLHGHYLHFCKTILWPVFHYQIPDSPKSKAYEDHSWEYYVRVNKAFADRIVHHWKRGDVIWVHDYHLLLVPSMIRKQIPDAKIGFFLHIAFPSSEVFRCLAVREELLKGVLGANLIGFQTQEYCHHFLQTCSRLLSVEATNEGVQLEDRLVNVGTFPIGIDIESLDRRRKEPDVQEKIDTYKSTYEGKRLVVARDKLDHIRGVRQKLLIWEYFLKKYPKWQDKAVLVQVGLSTAEQPELDATVSEIVMRVNSAFDLAKHSLIFLKQDIAFSEYLGLITNADVLMVTSLREGMNLTSHEFIHCQDGKYSNKKHGCLILSEFTGSASLFEGHELLVNPWNYQECAEALNKALEMGPEDKEISWRKLNDAVTKHTTTKWFRTFLDNLSKAWDEQSSRDTVSIPRLSVNELSAKYRRSSRRLFIIDYEGTLASWGSPSSIVLTTPKRAVDTLNDLIDDPKNIVYVTSSRKPEEMERLFSPVAGLGLIAENGAYVRETGTEEWIRLVDAEETNAWKDGLSNMITYFRERTLGSWVEYLHSSLVFHYEDADDPQGAERTAAECADHINDICARHHVHAVLNDKFLVIGPITPNKATAAGVVWQTIQRSNSQLPDFLLVVGDGREDEVVFRWANKLGQEEKINSVSTVTLGTKNTEATATLTQGVTGVLSCLQKLAAISQSEKASGKVV